LLFALRSPVLSPQFPQFPFWSKRINRVRSQTEARSPGNTKYDLIVTPLFVGLIVNGLTRLRSFSTVSPISILVKADKPGEVHIHPCIHSYLLLSLGERTGLLKAKSKNDMLDSKNYSQNFNNHVQKLIYILAFCFEKPRSFSTVSPISILVKADKPGEVHIHPCIHSYLLLSLVKPFTMRPTKRGVTNPVYPL
jgi:hypothetical protein